MTTPKKPPAAKPPAAPRKKPAPPKKAPPSTGPLGPILVDKLKRAPTGASDSAIIMETLRSVPVEQLKDDLTKAPPKARNQLFTAIPADQIKAIVGSLSPSVLAPAAPPPPPPSPKGGPPATILQTSYENVPYPPAQSDPDWAQKVSGGSTVGITSPPPWEWVSVYEHTREKEGSLNNPAVGLTGWIVAEDPPLDVWFVHPFGFDFEFFIAPDPQCESLLGAHNTGRDAAGKTIDQGYDRATQRAQQVLGLPATKASSASRPTRTSCRRPSASASSTARGSRRSAAGSSTAAMTTSTRRSIRRSSWRSRRRLRRPVSSSARLR